MSNTDGIAEAAAIKTLLDGLTAPCYRGVKPGDTLPIDGFERQLLYRDLSVGAAAPAARGRGLAWNELDQPHILPFAVEHVCYDRALAENAGGETHNTLVGKTPTANCGQVKAAWSKTYSVKDDSGAVREWRHVRYYEVAIGMQVA